MNCSLPCLYLRPASFSPYSDTLEVQLCLVQGFQRNFQCNWRGGGVDDNKVSLSTQCIPRLNEPYNKITLLFRNLTPLPRELVAKANAFLAAASLSAFPNLLLLAPGPI